MSIPPDDLTYGPSALATPANAVTVLRLLLAPVAFGLIVADDIAWLTFALWVGLAATDGLDGFLARRHGTTRSGAFLDPLADKVLMLGGLVALVSVGRIWWFPVAVIGVREIVISMYRSYWGRRGVAVPAIGVAKAKTAAQGITVGFAILPVTGDLHTLVNLCLWSSVVLAVWSGTRYLLAGTRAHTTMQADA